MNRVWLVLSLFTLAFDSSPIKGEGIPSVVLDFSPATPCHSECSEESKISDPHNPALWIPAYAGMTRAGSVILALRQYPQDRARLSRHCGLDPQSRGVLARPGPVILALRQYP